MTYSENLSQSYKIKQKRIDFQGREMMIRDLSHLDFKNIDEWAKYFRDMLHLKEKLQEARSELKVERFKNRLIE